MKVTTVTETPKPPPRTAIIELTEEEVGLIMKYMFYGEGGAKRGEISVVDDVRAASLLYLELDKQGFKPHD